MEHSNVTAINKIMFDAGYKIYHEFGLQDFLYVKDNPWLLIKKVLISFKQKQIND